MPKSDTPKLPKAKDLNQMTTEELRQTLSEAKLNKMKIDGKVKKGDVGLSGAARNNRTLIARCLTILQKRGVSG